jgi:hypothetical protein
MLIPIWLAGLAADLVKNTRFISGEAIVLLVVGMFLSYKAYMDTTRPRRDDVEEMGAHGSR